MSQENINITEAEWEVMRTLWAKENITSGEIIKILQQKKQWSIATIKTLIGRLSNKGIISSEKDGRKFKYSARISEDESLESLSDEIFSRICRKKQGKVVGKLIEKLPISINDIDELIKKLEKKKESAPDQVECNCLPGQCKCHLDGW